MHDKVAASSEVKRPLARAMESNGPILITGCLATLTLLGFLASKGVTILKLSAITSNLQLYLSCIVIVLAFNIVRIVFLQRPDKLTDAILKQEFNSERRRLFFWALPVIVTLAVFMPYFSAMKSSIELFNEYGWDSTFISLDKQLHGRDAWLLLQPVFGHPLITSALSGFYHLWILLIYAGGIYFAFLHSNVKLRQRYFISYFLIWVVNGSLLAVIFASVGPCFAEPLLGRSDFVPLMEYLRQANEQYPVLVLDVQDKLLNWHAASDQGLGRGITAMPSMHVSLALLVFLAARHISTLAGWVFGAFFAIILIGSVHLGYHYAVDGYLSILTTLIVWKLATFIPSKLSMRQRPIEYASTH